MIYITNDKVICVSNLSFWFNIVSRVSTFSTTSDLGYDIQNPVIQVNNETVLLGY